MKTKTDTNKLAIERGKRLRAVIDKHFGNQRRFANAVGLTANTINDYVQGRRIITNDYAMKLELKAGISSEYLLEGTGEMLNPKFSIHKLPTFLLTVAGISEEIFETEKIDIFRFLTNGLKNPTVIIATSQQFCINSKIKYNALLIIDKDNFSDGDNVLAIENGKYVIAKYYSSGFQSVVENTEILGRVVYKIEDYNL